VFYRVSKLKRGDPVEISYDNETSKRFMVTEVLQFPKNDFPTDLVYRATDTDLRLVTCGGEFDRETGHYVDNVIVVASPSPLFGEDSYQ
jgi:Sortase domain